MTHEPPTGNTPPYHSQPSFPHLPAHPDPDPRQPPAAGLGPSRVDSNFERLGALASGVIAVAVALTVIQWLWVLTVPSTVQAYQNAAASGRSSYDVLTAYDFVSFIALLVFIAAYVLTGIWLGRARRNAERVAPGQQRLSAIWVWLGWIVPVVFLWFPKQVVDDVWRSTARESGPPKTGWWWGAWLSALLLANLAAVAYSFFEEPNEAIFENLVLIELLTALALTVALVGWIRVVRAISQTQDAIADKASLPTQGQPGPWN